MEETLFNFHDIILLTTIYQSLLFAALIFAVRHDRKSDIFLIGFLLTQAAIPLHTLINYGAEFRFIALDLSPNLYRSFEVAYWLEGPLLLWYTRSLVYKNYALAKVDLVYVLPAILFLIYVSVIFFTLGNETKVNLLRDHSTVNESFLDHFEGFAREGLRVLFSVLCIIEIRRCRMQIRDQYSSLEKIDLGWLNFLIFGFLFIHVLASLVSIAIILTSHTPITINFGAMGLIANYLILGLVSAMIYFSIRHSTIFEGIDKRDQHTPSSAVKIDMGLVDKIQSHMQTEKPYLATILTLEQLANQLGVAPRTLSQVINRHFKRNFFEFINEYRVDEAKVQLSNPENSKVTMLELMGNCGFNSKATFNTFFKKIVGSTPSQYRSKVLGNG